MVATIEGFEKQNQDYRLNKLEHWQPVTHCACMLLCWLDYPQLESSIMSKYVILLY